MGTVSKFWDEAMLVAYVDGELDAATARRLEAAIAEDPAAQAQLRLLRESAAATRDAYAEILTEPVPERLKATLIGRAGRGGVVPLRPKAGRPSIARALMPIAASLLLVALGFAAGIYAERTEDGGLRLAAGPGGDAPFEAALGQALAADALGRRFDYADAAADTGGSVLVTGTFTAGFGASCREFRHEMERMGQRTSEAGIACRRADGGWELLTLAEPSGG
jgi:anti-sigma factor RsiW